MLGRLKRCRAALPPGVGPLPKVAPVIDRTLGLDPLSRFFLAFDEEVGRAGTQKAPVDCGGGLWCLDDKSCVNSTRTRNAVDEGSTEALRVVLQRSPRDLGRHASLWTLSVAAKIAFEGGLTGRLVSRETFRAKLLHRLGVRWRRAKRWITSPDSLYERNKTATIGCLADGGGRGEPRHLGGRLRARVLVEQCGGSHLE